MVQGMASKIGATRVKGQSMCHGGWEWESKCAQGTVREEMWLWACTGLPHATSHGQCFREDAEWSGRPVWVVAMTQVRG